MRTTAAKPATTPIPVQLSDREFTAFILHGVCPSPATRTRRSPSMRVKLQLVICHDDGQEETVTDVIALNKNNQRKVFQSWVVLYK